MKKHVLFLCGLFLTANVYAQITYEKGYYIDNAHQKVDCFIKNIDWANNPNKIEYKLREDSDKKKATIADIQEFGIYNTSKFIRKKVKIDRSSKNTDELSTVKEPIFNEEELFLKVLVEGKANLYEYVEGNLRRYFYNKNNSSVEPLIYKTYKKPSREIGINNSYRQQLWKDLSCSGIGIKKIENLEYKRKNLIQFFTEYSECHHEEVIVFQKNKKGSLFHLTLRPRLNRSFLKIQNTVTGYENTSAENNIGFGIEAEFVLPFNKNKWGVVVEPTYQNFKSETTITANGVLGGKIITTTNYNSIEVPIGLRHYFFLNKNSKIFVNASYVLDVVLKSSIESSRENGSSLSSLAIDTRTTNLAFGVGYKYNDKYSLAIRYQTGRTILASYDYWNSDFKTISIVFGYSIL